MIDPQGYDSHTTSATFDPTAFGLTPAEEHQVGGVSCRFFTREGGDGEQSGACIARGSDGSGVDAYHYRHLDSGIAQWVKIVDAGR